MQPIPINLDYDWPLRATVAPWKIAPDHSGKLTKIFAWRGKVSQYAYGSVPDTSEWPPGWQKALVTSFESGLIVLDADAGGFGELMGRCGIPLSPLVQLTGRGGGRHYFYDGRHLARGDWPGQRALYAADGVTMVGDVKSAGFVPVPGSIHPDGRRYQLAPDSRRGFEHALRWQPEWTAALNASQVLAGHLPAGYRKTTGPGRNNFLYALKKRLFFERFLDEDDPELHRIVHQANAEFDEPLDEEEVRHTVLRVKGWKRHGHLGPPLEYADPEEPAGPGIFVPEEDLEQGHNGPQGGQKTL